MKILIVSFYYTPELGAAPSRIANMAEGLKTQGAEVDVLTCLPNYPQGQIFEGYRGCLSKKEKINGINVYRYWTYATVSKNPFKRAVSMMSFATMLWLFAFKIKKIQSYDRVIIQSPPLPVAGSAITLFKKIFGRKILVNISDLWPLSAVELGAMCEGGKIYNIFAWIERYIYRNADGIFGQSEEIIRHVNQFPSTKNKFVYRNLQQYAVAAQFKRKHTPFRIVYAGLLGVAQDIYSIIENIPFKSIGAEFHLYGGGNQAEKIKEYINKHPDCFVYYHGYVKKEQIAKELSKYDASIVPLTVAIRGAVPSKIYDLIPIGIPILYCGGGEGAEIVSKYYLGMVSQPHDFKQLHSNIIKLINLPDEEYRTISKNCLNAAKNEFDFSRQIYRCYDFIKSV